MKYTSASLAVTLHGLHLRGEHHAANIIEHLTKELEQLTPSDEWEYGVLCPEPVCTVPHPLLPGERAEPHERVVRRRPEREIPPGPWEPVEAS